MATEVLRSQEYFTERFGLSPCRRRNYTAVNGVSSSHNFNSKINRKQHASTNSRSSERNRHQEFSINRRHSSADGYRTYKTDNNHRHNHYHGSRNLVTEKVTILRRGESLDSNIKSGESSRNAGAVAGKSEVYAGFGFDVSPAPSCLPLPSFNMKKPVVVDDLATRDLRRLLRIGS